MKKSVYVKYITKVAVLSAVAFVLMFLEIPLPIFPAFLKIDLSDLPALLGGFALGPSGACVCPQCGSRNIVQFATQTGGLGCLSAFALGGCLGFLFPGLLWRSEGQQHRRCQMCGHQWLV